MRYGIFLMVFSVALAVYARDAEEHLAKGIEAYAAEDYDRAMEEFEQAVEAAPEVARYHHWLGKAAGRRAERVIFFRAIGLAKKVRQSFERAAELEPTNMAILNDLMDFYLQAPGIVGGGEDKAETIAARVAKLDPAEGHRAQALIFVKRKDYEGAEKEFRKAIELEPDRPGRLLELAAFLSERGRWAEADALFERAAAIDAESTQYLFTRGKELAVSKREPRRARELLERYLKANRKPDDPPASEVRDLLKKL